MHPRTQTFYGYNIQGNGLNYFITNLTAILNFTFFLNRREKATCSCACDHPYLLIFLLWNV